MPARSLLWAHSIVVNNNLLLKAFSERKLCACVDQRDLSSVDRDPLALSSALTVLVSLQPKALDPQVLVSNYNHPVLLS